jgi:hypothetical protein
MEGVFYFTFFNIFTFKGTSPLRARHFSAFPFVWNVAGKVRSLRWSFFRHRLVVCLEKIVGKDGILGHTRLSWAADLFLLYMQVVQSYSVLNGYRQSASGS